MASIRRGVTIAASPQAVWDAVRDVGNIHKRLVPGFVTDCRMEGDDARIVTFGNGMVVREVLVDRDDAACRLCWSARSDRLAHHNASMQVFPDGENGTQAVWIADVLPNEIAPAIAGMIDQGLAAMKKTLER